MIFEYNPSITRTIYVTRPQLLGIPFVSFFPVFYICMAIQINVHDCCTLSVEIRRWLSVCVGDDAVTSMLSSGCRHLRHDESKSSTATLRFHVVLAMLRLFHSIRNLVLWLCVVAWKYNEKLNVMVGKQRSVVEGKTYPASAAAASAVGPFAAARTADRCTDPCPDRPDSWSSFVLAHRRSEHWRPKRRPRRAWNAGRRTTHIRPAKYCEKLASDTMFFDSNIKQLTQVTIENSENTIADVMLLLP